MKKGTFRKFKKNFQGRKNQKFNLDERNSKGVAYNDISWYKKNTVIAENFNRLPFNYVVGSDLLVLDSPAIGVRQTLNIPLMAVFGIDWIPDNPNEANSILNQVATILYTLDRKANSGATNYEFADVFTSNVLGAIDVFCQIADLTRKLNLVNSYSWKNRTIPKLIIEEAFALDYNDLVQNLNAYIGRFNTLLAAANTIKLPNQFDFVKAAMSQYTQVFKDADSDTGREQIFVGVKYFHHIYDPTGTSTHPGGMVRLLTQKDMGSSATTASSEVVFMGRIIAGHKNMHKFAFELDVLEKCIYALISDQDFNTIQGDLEKAFGENGSFVVSDVLRDITPVYPVYSGEFRAAFENGRFWPLPIAEQATSGDNTYGIISNDRIKNEVRQMHDSNGNTRLEVKFQLQAFSTGTELPDAMDTGTAILSSTSDAPSVDDVIYMTRYCNTFRKMNPSEIESSIANQGVWATFQQNGCFVVYEGFIITKKQTTGTNVGDYGYILTRQWSRSDPDSTELRRARLAHMFEFFMQLWTGVTTGTLGDVVDMALDNPKVLHNSDLKGIHDSAFLSLWNLPFNKSF